MKTLYDCLEEGENLINSDYRDSNSEEIFSLYQSAMLLTYDPVESIAMLDHFIEFIDKCHLNPNLKLDACKYSKFLLEKLSENYQPNLSCKDIFTRFNALENIRNHLNVDRISVKINPFHKFLNNHLNIREGLYSYKGNKIKPQDLGIILDNLIMHNQVLISENNHEEKQVLQPHIDSLLKGYMPDFYE